jgi:hypothetical protein
VKLPKLSRPKGPSAKPSIRMPAFLDDLYIDLRERRLLPLIALLAVAIAATPLLLSQSAESAEAPVAQVPTPQPKVAGFAVVPAQPELRAESRLAHRKPKNPFQPRVGSGSKGEGGSGESPGGGETAATVTVPAATSAGSAPAPSEAGAPGGSPEASGESNPVAANNSLVLIESGVDLWAGAQGHQSFKPAVTGLTKLPSAKNPVVIYMGLSKNRKHPRALFLVSSHVVSFTGKTHCAVDKYNCQLLEVDPGNSLSFTYGGAEKVYKLKVLHLVAVYEKGGKRKVVRVTGKSGTAQSTGH